MLFNSVNFLIFFPIVVGLYFCIPKRFRYLWLLVTSYYFYMSWYPKWVVLLLFSTIVTWVSGLVLEWVKKKDWDGGKKEYWKKCCVFGSFLLNLSVLVLFKYSNFLIDNLNSVLDFFNIELIDAHFGLALPVGISFYTFQALSYTMDVYRDEIYAEKNFLKYALFVSFFPQLVAGPIERSKNLLRQINIEHSFSESDAKEGILLMLWGYFMKMVVADRIATFVDCVYGDYLTYSGWYLILASVLFAVQIYCDFAGYSTIAVGAAKILGYQLMDNFNCPYFSCTVSEFWRRWHISLSSWFRDYLYIPLGGNRKGTVRKYVNIMIVFGISGLWHGAEWSFIVWGLLNGAYQVFGAMTANIRMKVRQFIHCEKNCFSHTIWQAFITFLLVDFSWIFFRAKDFSSAVAIIKSIVHADNFWIFWDGSLYWQGFDSKNFVLMLFSIAVVLVVDMLKHRGIMVRKVILQQESWFRWTVYIGSILFILLFGVWGFGYNASSFIYFQF